MELTNSSTFVTRVLMISREDGKVSFGYSTLRGKRASMEDFLQAKVTRRLQCQSGSFSCFCGTRTQTCAYVHTGFNFQNLWLQFSQHPTNGSTVGFFGVFDGEQSSHSCDSACHVLQQCALVALSPLICIIAVLTGSAAAQDTAAPAQRHTCRRTCGRRCRATTSLTRTSSRL